MGVSRGLEHRLVGRDGEMAAALGALASGAGVVLAGPRGVGKSRLARALVEECGAAREVQVLWLTGSVSDPVIPFGAFAPLVPDVGSRPGRQPDPLYLLQSFRAAVLKLGRGRPLLLAVDDAHRLDDHSATLIFQLVAAGEAQAVIALLSGCPSPPALTSLWKEELLERVDVEPLPYQATVELVADLLAGIDEAADTSDIGSVRGGGFPHPVAGEIKASVWRISRGSPLVVRELIRASTRAGCISLRDSVWRLDGEAELGPRLEELLREHVDRLDPEETEALELVALAEPLPLKVLLSLVPDRTLDALQDGPLLAFERCGEEQVARTAHPVMGELVRRSIPIPRAEAMGARLADSFEADGRTEAELLRIVAWRLESGQDPGPDLLVRASLLAAEGQDWRLSARLARAALDAGGGTEAVLAAADAFRALGRYADALEVLGEQTGAGDDQVARAAVLRALVLFFGLSRLPEALDVLARAGEELGNPSDRAWLEAVAAGLGGFAGRSQEAVERTQKLLETPGLSPRAELAIRSVLAMGLARTGRTEQALEVLDGRAASTGQGAATAGLEVSRAAAGTVEALSGWTVTARVLAYRIGGRVEELERFSTSTYEAGVQLHDPRLQGPSATALGWAALEGAHLPRAVGWFLEATAALRAVNSLTLRVPALLGLAEALALTGDVDGARAALEEARPAALAADLLLPPWSVAAAWLAAASGSTTEALDHLQDAVEAARAHGQASLEVRALQCVVRLGFCGPAARLEELASWMEGPLIRIVAAHAAALADSDESGDALDAVAERYADLGLNLYAAEATAQACRAHESRGQSRRAAASAARGHFLLGSLDDGPPPLGLALALTPPELTRREREVAMLAARGLPSQAIATKLCLSVRTVETHLARVYVKLGIGGRAELPVALLSAAGRAERVEAV